MSAGGKCIECGTAIPADSPGGCCGQCLLRLGLQTAGEQADAVASGRGRHFGDYELLEEIARGGMGVVYKARQKSLGRLVAVKTLLCGPHASADFIKRFHIEASAAAALQHPNIVGIHEVGVHQDEHFLVMDYVEGPNLAKFVKEQPLPAKQAARYLKTIAAAVHYAHERGILHRDLKPSNVLIDSDGQPRVTDFGLAKRLDTDSQPDAGVSQLTLSGQVMGSPGYMPPEQASGLRGKMSRWSDVYSLGAMLYHLLTGRPPFVGETVAETLHQVLHAEPVSPRLLNAEVPEDLAALCLKCLEKEPLQRYPTAEAVADELRRFLEDEPVMAAKGIETDFDQTRWVNPDFSYGYLEQADGVIPERRYLFHICRSFLDYFAPEHALRVCDLGCGDGALAEHLLAWRPDMRLTLLDGSEVMLNSARKRLGERVNLRFVRASFDQVTRKEATLGIFDFIVTSFAIHHITQTERVGLFFQVMEHLEPGGWFLNIDGVLSDEAAFVDWQFKLWREWILAAEKQQPPHSSSLRDAPDLARQDTENKFGRLAPQLNALRSLGFVDVDCLYRNSIFVIYCARKPTTPKALTWLPC